MFRNLIEQTVRSHENLDLLSDYSQSTCDSELVNGSVEAFWNPNETLLNHLVMNNALSVSLLNDIRTQFMDIFGDSAVNYDNNPVNGTMPLIDTVADDSLINHLIQNNALNENLLNTIIAQCSDLFGDVVEDHDAEPVNRIVNHVTDDVLINHLIQHNALSESLLNNISSQFIEIFGVEAV